MSSDYVLVSLFETLKEPDPSRFNLSAAVFGPFLFLKRAQALFEILF